MTHPMTATYQVTGLTCEHCKAAVTDEISALDGVTRVDVSLVAGGVSEVQVRSTGPLDAAAVRAAVDEAGYTVAS